MAMSYSSQNEMIIRVVPARHSGYDDRIKARRSEEERVRHYDVLIYTAFPVHDYIEMEGVDSGVLPTDVPLSLAGQSLMSVEHLSVHWGRYQEYLASFMAGEKLAFHMRHRLLDLMSHGLETLLDT
ncbi:MAG: hypothetical protein ACRDIB_06710, partial [Ardenticatenaceae bacterium]